MNKCYRSHNNRNIMLYTAIHKCYRSHNNRNIMLRYINATRNGVLKECFNTKVSSFYSLDQNKQIFRSAS